MITGMDRLNAAVTGTACDRIPVFCNLLDQGARELNLSIETYFSSGESVAEGQLRMREKYGYDNVWSLFYVGKEAELLGCSTILFAEEGPPNVGDWVIKTSKDIENLAVPYDLESHPGFAEQLKCLNILRKEVGGKYPICSYITSTMSLPILLMGMEYCVELLFTGPGGLVSLLLDKCFDFFVKEVTAHRRAGADILVYSNPFGSTDTVPRAYFVRQVLPWICRELEAVGTDGMVYYCGMSRFNRVLDLVLESTGFRAFYISPLDDVAEARKIIGDRGLTCGVINDIKLLDWTTDQVREEVRRIILDGAREKGRFLFGTGVMPFGIPETAIRTMLESAYAFGRL